MPLYEYECSLCGRVFEVMQKFSDAPLNVHENCGGAVHRLLSPTALQFKGTGWYITDYAKSSASSGEKGEKGEKKDGQPAAEAKDSKTTEAKPKSSSPAKND